VTAKPAIAQYPLHNLLAQRWSPLAFAEQPVEVEKLQSLLEAARWAASCFNEQPWRFIVATRDQTDEYARLLSCLVEANQTWAGRAPILMLTVASLHFQRNGKPNRHAWHDVGLAVGNLTVQATALGLYVHQMAGIEPEKARAVYGIPEGFEVVTGLAIGYLGSPESLPENLQQREAAPRQRRPCNEFVFAGQWGQAAPPFA